jgi:hypothetical protein
MPAMPADSDSLPLCPSGNTLPDRINDSGYFVAGDSRVLNAWERSLFCERVAVTYAASLNFDSHRSCAGFRDIAFNEFKWSIRLRDLHDTHF